ncbi:MAG: FAD binding domain-containing protein [Hyphomicrobiales bacterium]|nr:FAD binding domain-containing protein [Hyphomicrobiales bacterium]
MKAPAFAYVKPDTLAEAAAILAEHGENASILAGGQSLMPGLNFRLSSPEVLIDVNALGSAEPELADIVATSDTVRIGMLVRHSDIGRSPVIAAHLPIFAEVVEWVAHPAIRNRGTFCGSLAYADPAAEWPAIAVLLDATFTLASQSGTRQVRACDFYSGLFETSRAADEIIRHVEIPKGAGQRSYGFYELARRHGDFALAGVAVTASATAPLDGVRVVFFGVHSHARPAVATAAILNGTDPAQWDGSALTSALEQDLEPFDDIHATSSQRRHLAKIVLQRALAGMKNGADKA